MTELSVSGIAWLEGAAAVVAILWLLNEQRRVRWWRSEARRQGHDLTYWRARSLRLEVDRAETERRRSEQAAHAARIGHAKRAAARDEERRRRSANTG